MLNKIEQAAKRTPRQTELQQSMAHRLAAMADLLMNKRDTGSVMDPEDIAELARRVRTLARDARQIEGETRSGLINPAIPEAFKLLTRAETEIGLARNAVRDRLEEQESDPNGKIARRLELVIANCQQVANLLGGRGRTQS